MQHRAANDLKLDVGLQGGFSQCIKAAGMADKVEDQETCCYAEQNKVWSVDPQGMRWEWYRVIRDAEEFGEEPVTKVSGPGCCG